MESDINQNTLTLEISGKPIAKARPRFARVKKKNGETASIAYNPQETEEGYFVTQAISQLHGRRFTGPVRVWVRCFFPRPKGHLSARGEVKASAPKYHTVKPDFDNLLKFVLDCLNTIAVNDDSQFVGGGAEKEYAAPGEGGKTVVYLEALEW